MRYCVRVFENVNKVNFKTKRDLVNYIINLMNDNITDFDFGILPENEKDKELYEEELRDIQLEIENATYEMYEEYLN